MKITTKVFIAALMLVSTSLFSQSLDFKGAKPGMLVKEFKTQFDPSWISGQAATTIAGTPCLIKCGEDGLQVKHLVITGDPMNTGTILEALTGKFGKPISSEESEFRNPVGGKWIQHTTIWQNETTKVTFWRYCPTSVSGIDTTRYLVFFERMSDVTVRDSKIETKVKTDI